MKKFFEIILGVVIVIGVLNFLVWALAIYNVLCSMDGGEATDFMKWWKMFVHQNINLIILGAICTVIAFASAIIYEESKKKKKIVA